MVRHECAEALGSIAAEECTDILKDYVADKEVCIFDTIYLYIPSACSS